jgi:hypothetical protein
MKMYVVTNPELGWDCVVGVFSDEDYVYSKYGKGSYVIHPERVQKDKYVSPTKEDLSKHGRTDFEYKVVHAENIKCKGDFKSEVKTKSGTFKTFNLIDPEEGDFFIEFGGKEQAHTVDNLSVVADLFCEHTKIDKDCMRIFSDSESSYYLGSIVEYEDSKKLWESFKSKGVEVYY